LTLEGVLDSVSQGLVLCLSYVPEKVGINKKGMNKK
jgi:hypothetical protein